MPSRFSLGKVLGPLLPTARRKGYAATITTSYVLTATTVGANLVLVPILVHGLGTKGFGLWLTLYAFGQWITVATSWPSPSIIKRVGTDLALQRPDLVSLSIGTLRI